MALQVRYFASLRERMGRDSDVVEPTHAVTVAEVWQRSSDGKPLPGNVLCAVNMEYVAPDAQVQDGDEVAFFPPVTGG